MNEEKKVPFKWEYGEETISLQLGMYANNQRLYIGMITHTEDGAEPFADMTVNLSGYSLDPGEAFISGDISKDLLRFIKENKLGKVLPYQVQSGYGKYSAVVEDFGSSGNSDTDPVRLDLCGDHLCFRSGAGAYQHGDRPVGRGGPADLFPAKRHYPAGDGIPY